MVVRAVATADNHLGRFYDRMPPSKLEERRSYLRRAFGYAVEYAIEWQAHLFLIAGDLFDQPDPRNIDRSFVANCLSRLRDAGVRVFAIGGNHDTPRQRIVQGGHLPHEIYRQLGGLICFDDDTKITTELVEIEGWQVAIGGMNYNPTLAPGRDPLEYISWDERPADADMSILLLHGLIEGHTSLDAPEPIFRKRTLVEFGGADVFIIGDIHKPAVQSLGQHTLIIPGSTECITFGDEPDAAGFVALELGKGGLLSHKRVSTPVQPRRVLHIKAETLDPTDPTGDLIRLVEEVAAPDALVKLSIDGTLHHDVYHQLHVRQLIEAVSPLVFHFTLDTGGLRFEDERGRQIVQGVVISQQDEINDYIRELVNEAEGNPAEQHLLEEVRQTLLSEYQS